jgi:hypothetical protein
VPCNSFESYIFLISNKKKTSAEIGNYAMFIYQNGPLFMMSFGEWQWTRTDIPVIIHMPRYVF